MNNKFFIAMISFLVIYKLLASDLKMLFLDKKYDYLSYGMSTFCLFVFAIEMLMQCWVVEGYIWKFFFWIDFVATITIILDIGWIMKKFETPINSEDNDDTTAFVGLIKASKAAKIIKVIRVIRVIRIVRLYRQM